MGKSLPEVVYCSVLLIFVCCRAQTQLNHTFVVVGWEGKGREGRGGEGKGGEGTGRRGEGGEGMGRRGDGKWRGWGGEGGEGRGEEGRRGEGMGRVRIMYNAVCVHVHMYSMYMLCGLWSVEGVLVLKMCLDVAMLLAIRIQ